MAPSLDPRGEARFRLDSFPQLFGALKGLGFEVIGADFVSHEAAARGLQPPDWRPYPSASDGTWPSADTKQLWADLLAGAQKAQDAVLADVASRIRATIAALEYRLREVSEAYHVQLAARYGSDDFRDGERFTSGYTAPIEYALRAFFVEACTLRDYLAEYLASYVFPVTTTDRGRVIRRMSSLKKYLLSGAAGDDSLREELERETSKGGWIYDLGQYRDLGVHAAPFSVANGNTFLSSSVRRSPSGQSFPGLSWPLPKSPGSLIAERSKGNRFADYERWVAHMRHATDDPESTTDGLEYAARTHDRLVMLCRQAANRSPVPPERRTFHSSQLKNFRLTHR